MTTIAQILPQALAAQTSPATTKPPVSDWKPQIDAYEPSLVAASRHAAEFVAAVAAGASPYWLTLTGVPGCGKTMLARQAFAEASRFNPGNASLWRTGTDTYDHSRRRPRSVWLDATSFADRLRAKEYDLPEHLGADFLVVLDDLGAARDTTEFIADAVYRLCNARMGKWTIFTTNFSASRIAEQIDSRVASRMIRDANRAHRITAGDYALRSPYPGPLAKV